MIVEHVEIFEGVALPVPPMLDIASMLAASRSTSRGVPRRPPPTPLVGAAGKDHANRRT